MLHFDEFKAASDRERTQKKLEDNVKRGVQKVSLPSGDRAAGGLSGMLTSVGDVLEMPQLQTFLMILIVIDTFAAFMDIYLRGIDRIDVVHPFLQAIQNHAEFLLIILTSVNGFCLSLFAIELLLSLIVFRFALVGHIGYTIDFGTILFQLYLDMVGIGRESRILNMLRIWRLVRLFNTFVAIESKAHAQTMELLVISHKEQAELNSTIKSLQADIEKEKDAKNAVESMLQGYKDEVDTLNEALKIAAMDIADVAQADEELFESDDESATSLPDVGSERQREKIDDMAAVLSSSSSNNVTSSSSTTTTFFISEDGTIQKKY